MFITLAAPWAYLRVPIPGLGRAGRLLLLPGPYRAISVRRRPNGSELDESKVNGREHGVASSKAHSRGEVGV
jgi:hypothetical protein